jgi:hypothetical protein
MARRPEDGKLTLRSHDIAGPRDPAWDEWMEKSDISGLISLRADDHWILAVAGLGREDVETMLDHLKKAAIGFLLDWRFHFVDHPALWSLRDQPRYIALIASIEANMAEQHQTL